jgi:hypothetical protein
VPRNPAPIPIYEDRLVKVRVGWKIRCARRGCGFVFHSKRRDARFCSPLCRSRNHYEKAGRGR